MQQKFANFSNNRELIARGALAVIYIWFGVVKLLGMSQASPLATALVQNTIGVVHFNAAFMLLAIAECVIGAMFLLPRYTRPAVVLALGHMLVVCSPLLLVPSMAWQTWFVPTLEGQYIIKNLALVALILMLVAPQKAENP